MISSAGPYFPPSSRRRIVRAIEKVLASGRLLRGPYAEKFEKEFASRIGVRHAVSVNSCTTALEIALRFLELRGGEVMVPTNTFVATANAVIYAGGKPVFVEIRPEDLGISFADLQKKFSKHTRALIVVHLGGLVTEEFSEILSWARKRGVAVVEDCAHTLGGVNGHGISPGGLSFAGAFSFWPTKVMTTGTGGMLTTSSRRLAEYARSVRYHGLGGGDLRKIIHLGNDWALNEILACVGLEQLRVLDENLKRRRQVVRWYQQELDRLPVAKIPDGFQREGAGLYKFWITFREPVDVFELHERLNRDFHIQSEFLYWPPVPLMPAYRRMNRYPWRRFPQSDAALRNHLCLPLHPWIRRKDVKRVVWALTQCLKRQKR